MSSEHRLLVAHDSDNIDFNSSYLWGRGTECERYVSMWSKYIRLVHTYLIYLYNLWNNVRTTALICTDNRINLSGRNNRSHAVNSFNRNVCAVLKSWPQSYNKNACGCVPHVPLGIANCSIEICKIERAVNGINIAHAICARCGGNQFIIIAQMRVFRFRFLCVCVLCLVRGTESPPPSRTICVFVCARTARVDALEFFITRASFYPGRLRKYFPI